MLYVHFFQSHVVALSPLQQDVVPFCRNQALDGVPQHAASNLNKMRQIKVWEIKRHRKSSDWTTKHWLTSPSGERTLRSSEDDLAHHSDDPNGGEVIREVSPNS